jgi:nucleoid-associated protein EbfC
MSDILEAMKKMQAMYGQMEKLKNDISSVLIEGQAGAGLVRITVNGQGAMTSVFIDPSLMLVQERDVLQDLVVAAHTDARLKTEAMIKEKMQSVTGGINPFQAQISPDKPIW